MKSLYIAEKPSVAQEFAKALKMKSRRMDGYLESDDAIVTWCYGHLITMSYPDAYDSALKRWQFDTLPFLPKEWKYQVIESASKQFHIVEGLLNRDDVTRIYVCTDSGREGEYIYRLVDQEAHVPDTKDKRRVWIDSQTEEEILKGIKNAKPLSDYNNMSDAAYLRAKEDYLMGINFSRALTLKYGYTMKDYLKKDKNVVVAVGRVMTCVLGMIVRREREIRNFVKVPFYKVNAIASILDNDFDMEWRAVPGSKYYDTPYLYGDKNNGFKDKEHALELVNRLKAINPMDSTIVKVEKKTEKKNPPMLYNLAELQNDCSKFFKIRPDETLAIVQELYEKKLVTYPRTDARVLSTAVAKEIDKNLRGLSSYPPVGAYAKYVVDQVGYKNIHKSRYVNDKQITDHYAIIPTGQGLSQLSRVSETAAKVYELISRRFVSIFYPAAEYKRYSIESELDNEHFFSTTKVLEKPGYLKVANHSFGRKKATDDNDDKDDSDSKEFDQALLDAISKLRKGSKLNFKDIVIKEGESSPPKPYNSGSIILAMENAGKLIDDEELRAQIKGSGIGTSATRAEIIKKLNTNDYICINGKTQVLSPTQLGEMIYDVVEQSIKSMLNPELTASWEKGLSMVANGEVTSDEYMDKLSNYVGSLTNKVKSLNNKGQVLNLFNQTAPYYNKSKGGKKNAGTKN
ncbi:MAG: type IA DNA topoisomerase [Lachnospiraceae bacterium]|nr:type IA DNA topoisomerase [Lachnospiraceae bacterium]